MLKQKLLNFQRLRTAELIRQILTSWLFAVIIEYLLLPSEYRNLANLDGLGKMSLPRVIGVTCGITILQIILSRRVHSSKIERWSLPAVYSVLVTVVLHSSATWPFIGICCLIFLEFVIFGIYGWDSSPEPIVKPHPSHKAFLWITDGLSAAFFLLVSSWTVGRVYSFSSPTYDFGIFSQMFFYMKEYGIPMTTLERDGLLSHFAVHVSPIYYLMLPLYWLLPAPETLQILQAAIITSAVIPLWKIGSQHGLTGAQKMLSCAVLLLYPAFSGGVGYDIHENCFLTPLILWLLYGIDRKSTFITSLAAILTLMVKEDAPVYVAVIALWLIVKSVLRFEQPDGRGLVTGIIMLAVSLGWFAAVTGFLSKKGDGVMTYRYNNFLYDGSSSLITVIKSVILNPMKAVYECVDPEKLRFIALTIIPLLGLPLLTRRYERFILLIPYILVNLMSDYRYQHDIFFQYTFGSNAFLIYLTVVNLADFQTGGRRMAALTAAVMISAACFIHIIAPKAVSFPIQVIHNHQYYQSIRKSLDTIPEEASVAATTFYTTHLSQREILYDIRYCSREHLLDIEYVALNLSANNDYSKYATDSKDNGLENLIKLLEDHGFEPFHSLPNVLVIYHKDQRGV